MHRRPRAEAAAARSAPTKQRPMVGDERPDAAAAAQLRPAYLCGKERAMHGTSGLLRSGVETGGKDVAGATSQSVAKRSC